MPDGGDSIEKGGNKVFCSPKAGSQRAAPGGTQGKWPHAISSSADMHSPQPLSRNMVGSTQAGTGNAGRRDQREPPKSARPEVIRLRCYGKR